MILPRVTDRTILQNPLVLCDSYLFCDCQWRKVNSSAILERLIARSRYRRTFKSFDTIDRSVFFVDRVTIKVLNTKVVALIQYALFTSFKTSVGPMSGASVTKKVNKKSFSSQRAEIRPLCSGSRREKGGKRGDGR